MVRESIIDCCQNIQSQIARFRKLKNILEQGMTVAMEKIASWIEYHKQVSDILTIETAAPFLFILFPKIIYVFFHLLLYCIEKNI